MLYFVQMRVLTLEIIKPELIFLKIEFPFPYRFCLCMFSCILPGWEGKHRCIILYGSVLIW